MFVECSDKTINVVSDTDFQKNEISSEEFERKIVDYFLKKDYFSIADLYYINKNNLSDYEFINPKIKEINYIFNLGKNYGNYLFGQIDLAKLLGFEVKSIKDLMGYKVETISEFFSFRAFFSTILYENNPQLWTFEKMERREDEEAQITIMLLKVLDFSNFKTPCLGEIKRSIFSFELGKCIKYLFQYFDYEEAKEKSILVFEKFMNLQYSDDISISDFFTNLLNKKDPMFLDYFKKYHHIALINTDFSFLVIKKMKNIDPLIEEDIKKRIKVAKEKFFVILQALCEEKKCAIPTIKVEKEMIKMSKESKLPVIEKMVCKTLRELNLTSQIEKRIFNAKP